MHLEVDANLRVWVGTVIGGLIVAGAGLYDAFVNHSATLSATGDATFILGGAGIIAGKAIFDLGVAVPTPPKA